MILANDIRKDTKLRMTGGRTATMADNKKGIIRMVTTNEDRPNGIYGETGSCYLSEITHAQDQEGLWQPVFVTPAQARQLALAGAPISPLKVKK